MTDPRSYSRPEQATVDARPGDPEYGRESYIAPPSTRRMQTSAREEWRESIQGWTDVTFERRTYGVLVGKRERCFGAGPARVPEHVARELAAGGYLRRESDDGPEDT